MRSAPTYLIAMLMAVAGSAYAQVRPRPGTGDPRLQIVDYDPGQIVQLQGALGYQLTIQLSSDEQVQNVALGDSTTWQVSVNKAGDHLFIKPTQVGAPTNMTVITSVRVYNFELTPVQFPSSDVAFNLEFKYPASTQNGAQQAVVAKASAILRQASRYRIEGDRTVRPSSVSDDGDHTYVSWSADRPIPAIFQIGDNGEERLVNGGMRGDEFVIDGVAAKLVFRIDRKIASAVRRPARRHG